MPGFTQLGSERRVNHVGQINASWQRNFWRSRHCLGNGKLWVAVSKSVGLNLKTPYGRGLYSNSLFPRFSSFSVDNGPVMHTGVKPVQ